MTLEDGEYREVTVGTASHELPGCVPVSDASPPSCLIAHMGLPLQLHSFNDGPGLRVVSDRDGFRENPQEPPARLTPLGCTVP